MGAWTNKWFSSRPKISDWKKEPSAPRKKNRAILALEGLEERVVPALVTTLEDGPNPSSPLPGSLREAVKVLAKSNETITFDAQLFWDTKVSAYVSKTLTLNGAVGALNIEQTGITIRGPQDALGNPLLDANGNPLLTIQSDMGFKSVQVTKGGIGYKVGDILDQDVSGLSGGARFQVTAVGTGGVITRVGVVVPGANSTFSGKLSTVGAVPSATGVNRLNPVGNTSGTGAEFNPTGFTQASGLIFQQSAAVSVTPLSIEYLEFGHSQGTPVIQNLGSLSLTNCLFQSADSDTTTFVYTPNGASGLSLTNTTMIGGVNQIQFAGTGPVSISGFPNPSTQTRPWASFSGASNTFLNYTSTTGSLTISGADFDGASTQVFFAGSGGTTITNSNFVHAASRAVQTTNAAGSMGISKSTFADGEFQVSFAGSGAFSLADSSFTGAKASTATGTGYAVQGGGSGMTITNTAFYGDTKNSRLESGVRSSAATTKVTNSYFKDISNSALILNGSAGTITSAWFADNKATRLAIEPTTVNNTITGGGAIFAFGGGSLTIDGSLFENNSALGVDNFNSGGGAIHNHNGTLSINRTGFTNNAVSITGYPKLDPANDPTDFYANPELAPSPANSGGGAVYSGGGTTIRDSYFNKNRVTSTVDFWQYSGTSAITQPQFGGGGAIYLTSNNGNAINNISNTTIAQNEVLFDATNKTLNPYTGTFATGTGLNGGAILISSGASNTAPNAVAFRPFTGSTTTNLTNTTITSNTLVNPSVVSTVAVNSNSLSANAANGSAAYLNKTDTGGLFSNTSAGSKTNLLNTILVENVGVVYSGSGVGFVSESNTGTAPVLPPPPAVPPGSNASGTLVTLGHNLWDYAFSQYNPTPGDYLLVPGIGDLVRGTSPFSPIFAPEGLQANYSPNPRIGLATPSAITPAPAASSQTNILTIALNTLSPARDSGDSGVFIPNNPPYPYLRSDGRDVQRKINLAVDMGAFEVQSATRSFLTGVNSSPYTGGTVIAQCGVPFTLTGAVSLNDNTDPGTAITRTLLLTDNEGKVVYGSGTVIAGTPATQGSVVFTLNQPNPSVPLPDGPNSYVIRYSGDSIYAPSVSNPFTIDVQPTTPIVSMGAGSPNAQAPGLSVIFTGSIDPGLSNRFTTTSGTITLQAAPAKNGVATGAYQDQVTGIALSATNTFTVTTTFPDKPNLSDWLVRAVFVSADPDCFNNSAPSAPPVYQEIGYIPTVTISPFIPSRVERALPVTFKAVVGFNQADGVPTGNVTFVDASGNTIAVAPNPGGPDAAGNTITYTVTQDPTSLPINVTSQIFARYNRNGGDYLTTVSTNSQPLTITPIATSVVLARVTPSPSTYGTPVVFTATVNPQDRIPFSPDPSSDPPVSGSVTFTFTPTSTTGSPFTETVPLQLSAGRPNPATLTIPPDSKVYSYINAGTYTVNAEYSGDGANYSQSAPSNSSVLQITPASTSMTLTANTTLIEAGGGRSVNLSTGLMVQAPAPQPGLPVKFLVNGVETIPSPITLDSTGKLNFPWSVPSTPGNYSLQVQFPGNGNYLSSSATTVVSVYAKSNTTTTLVSSTSQTTYGNPVNFTVSISPSANPPANPPYTPGGKVTLIINGQPWSGSPNPRVVPIDSLGNPQSVVFSLPTLPAGISQVSAYYSGDGVRYQPSASNPVTVLVDKAATGLQLTASSTYLGANKPITFTATLTDAVDASLPQPAGSIDLYRDGLKIASQPIVNGVAVFDQLTPSKAGFFQYEARYAGSANYGPSNSGLEVVTFRKADENFYLVAPQQGSVIQVYDRITNTQKAVFQPFGPGYLGGFTVAKGDVNGDGVADILWAPRTGGTIQIFDGANYNPLGSVAPFGAALPGQLSIAVGDINADGYGDIIVAPAFVGMPPHVMAVSGKDFSRVLFSQYAYAPAFRSGVTVAAGEINGDGYADIITSPFVGAPPHVVTFSGKTGKVLQSYYAYNPAFLGGTWITASDLNSDGYAEIISGANFGPPNVVVVEGKTTRVLSSFYAYSPAFQGGVRVTTVQDANNDGNDDIITAPGVGALPKMIRFSGKAAMTGSVQVIDSLFAYGLGTNPSINYTGGTMVG
jgi:hypothetical protein